MFADHVAFFRGGQPKVGAQRLEDGRVATGSAEDERDRRQQAVRVEPLDHLDPAGDAVRAQSAVPTPVAAVVLVVGTTRAQLVTGDPHELRVHRCTLVIRIVDEQVIEAAVDEHVLPQRHRSVLLDHDGGVAANRHQPVAELFGVRHGRRQ